MAADRIPVLTERTYCSRLAAAERAPLAGSAESVDTWLLIEYRATWYAKATRDNALPASMRAFVAAAEAAGTAAGRRVRVQFVRRPQERAPGVRLMVAHCDAIAAGEIRGTTRADYDALAALDPVGVVTPGWGGLSTLPPQYLVCTNGQRDVCCSKFGRPLYLALMAGGVAVWQTTHVGGHRYAPNLICLPSGVTYGFMDHSSGLAAVDDLAAGRLRLRHLRGRSGQSKPVQAADYALRTALGEDQVAAIASWSVTAGKNDWDIAAAMADGAIHRVKVWQGEPVNVQASCGADGIKSARPWHWEILGRQS